MARQTDSIHVSHERHGATLGQSGSWEERGCPRSVVRASPRSLCRRQVMAETRLRTYNLSYILLKIGRTCTIESDSNTFGSRQALLGCPLSLFVSTTTSSQLVVTDVQEFAQPLSCRLLVVRGGSNTVFEVINYNIWRNAEVERLFKHAI